MLKKYFIIILFISTFISSPVFALSDDQIKQKIITESISNYDGNCPCPYNSDRAGRSCGGRSAWSRYGGQDPVCYEKDITTQMILAYKKRY